jgi:hypothetical protein
LPGLIVQVIRDDHHFDKERKLYDFSLKDVKISICS